MALFSKTGSAWYPHREAALDIRPLLAPGNYTVKKNGMTNQFFLEEIDAFKLPERVYGDITKQTNRIIRSFADRDGTTGVLLAGEKGSGKTLLSKNVCAELAKVGVPTIVINHPWYGDQFNSFVQTITQPAVIVFDEFEKVYQPKEQEHLLTLLDGVFSSKKLFLLTCNDQYRVDSHMRNRPGRIYYFLKFGGLAADFIREYAADNLFNQEYVEKVVEAAGLFSQFNFDMLQSLIEEMNRFDETPAEALTMLNAKPEADDHGRYKVRLVYENVTYEGDDLDDALFKGNPLQGGLVVEVLGSAMRLKRITNDDNDDEQDDQSGNVIGSCGEETDQLATVVKTLSQQQRSTYFDFDVEHFVRFDAASETFVFEDGGATCFLTRVREKQRYNFFAA